MPRGNRLREQLIELARNIQDSRDRGWNDAESLAEFNRLLPGTDIDNLCDSDWDIETIVDVCLGKDQAERRLNREELLALVRRFSDPNGYATEAESTIAYKTFERNCRHPAGGDLIFYPDEYFGGRSDPTAEEIVDKALKGE